uniref:Uncharacterized protein n=1 Tax=Triticum urartu TaxID=4572 RepID=A0A8R7P0H9_TRIUA
MVMGTHPVARGDTLRQGTRRSREATRRSREVTPHSKDTRLHLELTHLHLGHTLQHLGLTLLHLEREALMGRRGSSPTSCTALLVLMVVVMGTRLVVMGTHLVAMDTLHNKGTLLSMATPRSSMATLHSSMAIPLPATLAHPVCNLPLFYTIPVGLHKLLPFALAFIFPQLRCMYMCIMRCIFNNMPFRSRI